MESIRYITGSFSDAGAWSNKKKLRSLVQQKHTLTFSNKGITNPRNTDLSFWLPLQIPRNLAWDFCLYKNLNLKNGHSVQSIMQWVYHQIKNKKKKKGRPYVNLYIKALEKGGGGEGGEEEKRSP